MYPRTTRYMMQIMPKYQHGTELDEHWQFVYAVHDASEAPYLGCSTSKNLRLARLPVQDGKLAHALHSAPRHPIASKFFSIRAHI